MSPTAVSERSGAGVDPRIARRRREVTSARRRWWLRRLGVAVAVVAVVAAAAGATRTPLLDVDRIEVVGSVRSGDERIVEASGLELGAPVLELDTAAAAERVAALPWVDQVVVDASWRDGDVVITVTERVPAAVIATPQAWSLVDAGGRVLAVAARPPAPAQDGGATDGGVADAVEGDETAPTSHDDPAAVLPEAAGLVVVEGPEPPEAGGQLAPEALGLVEVARAVPPGTATRVVVVRGDDAGYRLELRPRGEVELGGIGELERKLQTLTTVLAEADLTCVATIDVRVPDTAVLTREAGCS